MEIWKEIPGYVGFMASNYGRIKSIERRINYGDRYITRKERILKPHKSKVGYYTVAPFQKTTYVHFLVTLTFLGEREKGYVVDHIDGDYLNNNILNLRYVTQKENVHNALRLGKIKIGQNCSWSILKEEDVIEIKKSNLKQNQLAKLFNVSRCTIYDIQKNKTWKYLNNA